MKMAVSAGIGLFITFVGLQSSGIIVKNESTLVTLGHLTDPPVLLAIFGIVITVILYAIKLPGSNPYLYDHHSNRWYVHWIDSNAIWYCR